MPNLIETLAANAGRYLDKTWDWNAFPANDGYAELERAQMRYVGSGGSPKTGDRSTLPPGAFTCSLIHQEPGRKASVHWHHIEELFFVHQGQLTMSWQFGDEVVDFVVGPGDAVLNPPSRPHGFRNDGSGDCVMQIMVATAAPMMPTYTDHPSEHDVSPLRPASPEKVGGYLAEIEGYLARGTDARPIGVAVDGGRFEASPYMMAPAAGGLVMPSHFTFAVDRLTRGARTPAYALDAEEAFMVVGGVLDVDLLDGTEVASTRLGPRDLLLLPPNVQRRLRNADAGAVTFASIVGRPDATAIGWADRSAMALAARR